MPFDPENPDHISKLNGAVEASKKRLERRKATLLAHKAQYVGPDYGEDAAPDAVPVNIIELGVNTLQRFVASHTPQVFVDSTYRELMPNAASLELALNHEAERIDLGDVFNTWTHEALFCMGMLQVGLGADGRLTVDNVPFHRVILDMSVGEWRKQSYLGHEYDMPLEYVRENPDFDKALREKVKAPTREDQADYDHNPEKLQSGTGTLADQFEDMVTLRQLYLPSYHMVVRQVVGQEGLGLLQFFDWEGPARGMYHPLGYGKVPGCLIPNSPVSQWAAQHDIINTCWNKASNQAERQKTLLLVRGAAAADGQRIVKANDGEAIYSDDPGGCKEQVLGGADQRTIAMAIQARQLWNWMAGNIEGIGGLAAQSETLGQDRLLKASASGRTDDMQEITLKAQLRVFEDMAFWLWHDPLSEYHVIKTVEDTDYRVASTWTPDHRQGDFTDYNFHINPYSARPRSAQEEAGEFVSILQLYMQALPDMQAQGIALDWEYIAKRLAKLRHMPDAARIVKFMEGEAYPNRGPVTKPPVRPQHTTRTYVRENRPAANRQQQDEMLVQHLFGMNKQPAEMATLARVS